MFKPQHFFAHLFLMFASVLLLSVNCLAEPVPSIPVISSGRVYVLDMDMLILPGTSEYLQKALAAAEAEQAALVIVKLDTPGGIIQTSQDMVQALLSSSVPVVVYVSPQGGTATSAGVFITLAANIAAMAPGTTIGAAHPVTSEGKDIEGDMRTKAENSTIAMVKSIAEQRGRNSTWAENAVKNSSSLTETEAVKEKVVDFIAQDLHDLLKQLKGRKVKIKSGEVEFGDLITAEQLHYKISLRDEMVNLFANPNVAALLWLGATTGITLELYNPGGVIPGIVGVICLLLALLVSAIIPINQGGVLLIAFGALLLGAEIWTGSGALAVGGLISMGLGAMYLVDLEAAPGLQVSLQMFLPLLLGIGALSIYIIFQIRAAYSKKPETGQAGMLGLRGKAVTNIADSGKVFVNGEYWVAEKAEEQSGIIEQGSEVEIVACQENLALVVKKVID